MYFFANHVTGSSHGNQLHFRIAVGLCEKRKGLGRLNKDEKNKETKSFRVLNRSFKQWSSDIVPQLSRGMNNSGISIYVRHFLFSLVKRWFISKLIMFFVSLNILNWFCIQRQCNILLNYQFHSWTTMIHDHTVIHWLISRSIEQNLTSTDWSIHS